jgi:hypothetical protein
MTVEPSLIRVTSNQSTNLSSGRSLIGSKTYLLPFSSEILILGEVIIITLFNDRTWLAGLLASCEGESNGPADVLKEARCDGETQEVQELLQGPATHLGQLQKVSPEDLSDSQACRGP